VGRFELRIAERFWMDDLSGDASQVDDR